MQNTLKSNQFQQMDAAGRVDEIFTTRKSFRLNPESEAVFKAGSAVKIIRSDHGRIVCDIIEAETETYGIIEEISLGNTYRPGDQVNVVMGEGRITLTASGPIEAGKPVMYVIDDSCNTITVSTAATNTIGFAEGTAKAANDIIPVRVKTPNIQVI